MRIAILLGSRKRAADRTRTARDKLSGEEHHRDLVAKLREDRIDVCLIYAWREGVRAAQGAGLLAIVE